MILKYLRSDLTLRNLILFHHLRHTCSSLHTLNKLRKITVRRLCRKSQLFEQCSFRFVSSVGADCGFYYTLTPTLCEKARRRISHKISSLLISYTFLRLFIHLMVESAVHQSFLGFRH